MYRLHKKIDRSSTNPLFNRRNSSARWLFRLLLLLVIVAVSGFARLYYEPLQQLSSAMLGQVPPPTPFASVRAQQGQEAYLAGDIATALQYYELAVNLQPNNVNYLYEYGKLLIELDRTSEARAIGERVIQLAPSDPRGYALAASALVWSEPTTAIPLALTGIELGVPFAPLHAALAVAYTNIGRYQEALQRGDLAIRIDPLDASARRSYSYPLIFTGRYNEAIAQLEQAIAINPRIVAPYFELASLYRRINQEEMAVAIYNRVLEIAPNNERAYLRLCETYASKGLFREGEPFCQRALDINPLYADAHRMQGQLRYSRRNYEGAIESFNTCIALGSNAVECYYLRGLAHYFLGQCDDAWRVLNESIRYTNQEPILNAIKIGLTNVTVNCAGYRGQPLPTPIPPTPIPPTPIGGL